MALSLGQIKQSCPINGSLHPSQVSSYTPSGVVVKRVLSFYSLLPQATFNYNLELYPDLFTGLTRIIFHFKYDC